MTKLAENNQQGTANIADDRVLATVFDFIESIQWVEVIGKLQGKLLNCA